MRQAMRTRGAAQGHTECSPAWLAMDWSCGTGSMHWRENSEPIRRAFHCFAFERKHCRQIAALGAGACGVGRWRDGCGARPIGLWQLRNTTAGNEIRTIQEGLGRVRLSRMFAHRLARLGLPTDAARHARRRRSGGGAPSPFSASKPHRLGKTSE